MASPGSYDIGRLDNIDREVERLRLQALLTWPKEARLLGWYGLRDGMSVVEWGSGPGFVTEQLLEMLPHGEVTTVEVSPEMVERARRYLGEKGAGRLHAVQGDLLQAGLPDDTFDFVLGRFLFQHLPDPVAAAREARRLLKPGGKLVLVDVDDHLWGLADPPRPWDAAFIEKGIAVQAARGGDRLVGHKLLRILRAAGFANAEFDAVVYHSDLAGERSRELLRELLSPDEVQAWVKNGTMTREEADRLIAADQEWLASEHPMTLYPLFVGCGEKPGEPSPAQGTRA